MDEAKRGGLLLVAFSTMTAKRNQVPRALRHGNTRRRVSAKRKKQYPTTRLESANTTSSPDASWAQYIPIAVGVISVAFVAARLLSISSGDPETAYAVLQAEGTGSALAGSLIPEVGLLAFPISIALAVYAARKPSTILGPRFAVLITIGGICFVVAMFTVPVYTFILASLFTIFMGFSTWGTRRSIARSTSEMTKVSRPSLYEMCAVYAISTLLISSIIYTPWLPEDNFIVKGHADFSAFVLSQSSDTTVILTRNPAAVIQISTNQIIEQNICRPTSYLTQGETINEWLGSPVSADHIYAYPPCKKGYFSQEVGHYNR
jgi:hypothetical protein